MSGIEWSDNLSTGNEEIDRQHKELITAIQSLMLAIKEGHGANSSEAQNEAHDTLAFLESYVVEHFAYEEELMEHYDCPAKVINEQQHKIFLYRFKNLKNSINKNGFTSGNVVKLESLLCNWLVYHILEVDSQLHVAIDERDNQGIFGRTWNFLFKNSKSSKRKSP